MYVDSSVPADGLSFADAWSADDRAWLDEQLAEGDGTWLPAGAEYFVDQDLSEEAINLLATRGTPHPGLTLTQPARLVRPIGELPTTYIKCLMAGATPSPDVLGALKSPHWELIELQTGHWPMLSQPAEMAKILAEVS